MRSQNFKNFPSAYQPYPKNEIKEEKTDNYSDEKTRISSLMSCFDHTHPSTSRDQSQRNFFKLGGAHWFRPKINNVFDIYSERYGNGLPGNNKGQGQLYCSVWYMKKDPMSSIIKIQRFGNLKMFNMPTSKIAGEKEEKVIKMHGKDAIANKEPKSNSEQRRGGAGERLRYRKIVELLKKLCRGSLLEKQDINMSLEEIKILFWVMIKKKMIVESIGWREWDVDELNLMMQVGGKMRKEHTVKTYLRLVIDDMKAVYRQKHYWYWAIKKRDADMKLPNEKNLYVGFYRYFFEEERQDFANIRSDNLEIENTHTINQNDNRSCNNNIATETQIDNKISIFSNKDETSCGDNKLISSRAVFPLLSNQYPSQNLNLKDLQTQINQKPQTPAQKMKKYFFPNNKKDDLRSNSRSVSPEYLKTIFSVKKFHQEFSYYMKGNKPQNENNGSRVVWDLFLKESERRIDWLFYDGDRDRGVEEIKKLVGNKNVKLPWMEREVVEIVRFCEGVLRKYVGEIG